MERVQQADEGGLGKPFLVCPVDVTEHTVERTRVRFLNGEQGLGEFRADVCGRLEHIDPVAAGGDGERLEVGFDLVVELITVFGEGFRMAEVPVVGHPFEEHDGEHVAFEVTGVDRASECVRCGPQRGLQLSLGNVVFLGCDQCHWVPIVLTAPPATGASRLYWELTTELRSLLRVGHPGRGHVETRTLLD